MGTTRQEFSNIITKAVEALSNATEIEQITQIVATAARTIANADGTTFVLRDDGKCFYADENAISPLWKGLRFNMEACISGWAMINRQVVCIKDIYLDDRIPHDAYRPTFVKSLCMVPIRSASPLGAIGNYWSQETTPSAESVRKLQVLADCAAVAIENWELKQTLNRRNDEKSKLTAQNSQLESTLHILVHDLRNPVTSILAFTDLLKKRVGPVDDKSVSYFESITRTANRINHIIGRMLAVYKLTHQELNKQSTDLSIIGMEIESQLRAQDPNRDIHIQIDDQMVAHTDPLLIRLALENLFVNAYKFTHQRSKSEIHFGLHSENSKECTFFVKDNGVGFDKKETPKLFKPLSRLHDSSFSGTGLGLASVAQIINAHGGVVHAEAEVDKGATFYFSLPKVDKIADVGLN